MSCNLTQGFTIGCKDAQGGVKKFFFGNFAPSTYTIEKNATGIVTSIEDGGATKVTLYAYECVKETSSIAETIQINTQNGTVTYEQTATYVLNKMEQTKRNEVKLLAQATLWVVAQDFQDNYWLLGEVNGMDIGSDSTAQSGLAYGDRNGYSLSFTGMEPEPMTQILSTAFTEG